MTRRVLAVLSATLILVVGCGNDTADPTDSTGASTTTTSGPAPNLEDVVFDVDGLGVVDFGDEADDALAVLLGAMGTPDQDTGWGDPSDPANGPLWPGCPGSIARIVTWEGLLEVVFTDWDQAGQPADGFRQSVETPYLAGAVLWADSPIATLDGARSGDTVGRLRAIYGDRLWISPRPDEAVGLRHFSVDDETHPGPLHRTGGLRGWVFWPGYPDSPSTAPTVTAEVAPASDDDVTAGFTAGVSCSTP